MQADGLGDVGAEQFGQQACTADFMPIVDTVHARSRVGDVVFEVADVVQQRGGHQRVRSLRQLSPVRRLQGVVPVADRLAGVAAGGAEPETFHEPRQLRIVRIDTDR